MFAGAGVAQIPAAILTSGYAQGRDYGKSAEAVAEDTTPRHMLRPDSSLTQPKTYQIRFHYWFVSVLLCQELFLVYAARLSESEPAAFSNADHPCHLVLMNYVLDITEKFNTGIQSEIAFASRFIR